MTAMRIDRLTKWGVISRYVLVVTLMCWTFGSVCPAQTTTSPECHTSTVADAWGPEFASQAKEFFIELQSVVRNDNKKQFASFVQYPIHIYGANGAPEITNSSDLLRRYTRIITPDAREAILAQSPECLFGNGQGVMAAGGRLWFQKQKDGKFKIITLNIVRPK